MQNTIVTFKISVYNISIHNKGRDILPLFTGATKKTMLSKKNLRINSFLLLSLLFIIGHVDCLTDIRFYVLLARVEVGLHLRKGLDTVGFLLPTWYSFLIIY